VYAVSVKRTFAYACWLLRDFREEHEYIAPKMLITGSTSTKNVVFDLLIGINKNHSLCIGEQGNR